LAAITLSLPSTLQAARLAAPLCRHQLQVCRQVRTAAEVEGAMAAALGGQPYGLYSFMLLMLVAGTVNMVLLKFQHLQLVPMRPGGPAMPFDHPWLQAGLMMVGECLCLPVYLLTRTQEDAMASCKIPKWVFLVPCCFDLVATALLCMGLALIAVSVAQMCRGTVVIFACALSVAFLGRRLQNYHLIGVALVLAGVVLVSASALWSTSSMSFASAPTSMATGISLCVCAQLFQASMFVYEERIMSQYPAAQPLQVVGTEGIFGVAISAMILSILYALGRADTPGALHQIASSPRLLAAIISSVLAVAFFNFAGATVTQKSSAIARTTIKISSTISIWAVELALGWNTFRTLQLLGFVLVAVGTLTYNRIVVAPFLEPSGEEKAVLARKGQDSV